jgi:regulator of replication initiation timing
MKESTLLEMQNKINAMTRVLQQLINENTQLRDLAIENLKKTLIKKDKEKDGDFKSDTK